MHPNVRREFRLLAAKATRIANRPNTAKTCLSTIGLVGFILTFIIIVINPVKGPESIQGSPTQEMLRERLRGQGTDHVKDLFQSLMWRREFLNVRAKQEKQLFGTYIQLLQNHLNSRRVVRIIREESEFNVAKPKKCKPVVRRCSMKPYNLRGRLPLKEWISHVQNESADALEVHLRVHEGIWQSHHCTARHSVAIIIPYRAREKQLGVLLHHLPAILKRQHINYSIFVVEQLGDNTMFNKGILMNAGFLTALTRPAHGVTFHCFIFHDVDLLSEDDRNMYSCPERPRHMSVAVDELNYELPYSELLGGVFAIKTEHFLEVNGYSNLYWGWGGEDDDMGLRVSSAFGQVLRPDRDIGRYSSVQHQKLTPWLPLVVRRRLKKLTRLRYKTDGVNSVKYTLVKVEQKHQYTHILVDVGHPPSDMIHDLVARTATFYKLLKPQTEAGARLRHLQELIGAGEEYDMAAPRDPKLIVMNALQNRLFRHYQESSGQTQRQAGGTILITLSHAVPLFASYTML